MKTNKLMFLAVASFMTLFLNAQNLNEMKTFEPVIRDVEEMHMVYYNFTGPYDQSFNAFGELMQYIQVNQLPMGAYSLGLFYDDPAVVPAEELKSEVGFMLTGPINETEKYKYQKIEAGKAVSVKYSSMDEIFPAYTAIANFIKEQELQTADYSMEIYYSADPNVVDAEILMMIKN